MTQLPFVEESKNNFRIRTFSENVDSDELKWHRDRENRIVEVIDSNNWKLQMDNELPIVLENGKKYYIPMGEYHRVIKGSGDLKVSIELC